MISVLLLLQIAAVEPAVAPAGPSMLPPQPWYSARTLGRAEAYHSCRRAGVEGMMLVETAAEGRSEVAMMLYAQRANCHRQRDQILSALRADVRRNRQVPGMEEYLLDMLDRNIDAHVQSLFDWSGLPEQ